MTGPVRPDTALLVQERLRENQNDVDALFTLAALRANDGNVREGLTILDRVLRIDPRYPGAWIFKAKLHRMHGEPDQADSAQRVAEATEP